MVQTDVWERAFMEAFVDLALQNKEIIDDIGWEPVVFDFNKKCRELIST